MFSICIPGGAVDVIFPFHAEEDNLDPRKQVCRSFLSRIPVPYYEAKAYKARARYVQRTHVQFNSVTTHAQRTLY